MKCRQASHRIKGGNTEGAGKTRGRGERPSPQGMQWGCIRGEGVPKTPGVYYNNKAVRQGWLLPGGQAGPGKTEQGGAPARLLAPPPAPGGSDVGKGGGRGERAIKQATSCGRGEILGPKGRGKRVRQVLVQEKIGGAQEGGWCPAGGGEGVGTCRQ